MKFALLGADRDCLELLAAIAQSPSHEILAVYDADRELEEEIKALAPRAKWNNDWEALLHEPIAEVVIVAPWRRRNSTENAQRADQLRKLVQASVPLIVIHPGCESILGFEIDMIRQDTKSLVVPFLPASSWLPIAELMSLIEAPAVKEMEQVFLQVERCLDSSADEARVQLARDVCSLAKVLGRVRRVNAFGTAFRGGPSRLTVHLDSEAGGGGQWSLLSTTTIAPDRVHVTTSTGSATAISLDGKQWRLETAANSVVVAAPNLADQLIRELPEFMQKEPDQQWSNASRAQEVTELAERSAERGRTLELYHEDHSEEETFKGIMAVGSCAVLVLSLLILIIGSVIEGIRLPYVHRPQATIGNESGDFRSAEDVQQPASQRALWNRLWPVYPIAFFLLLQLLRLTFPKNEKRQGANAPLQEPDDSGDL